MLETLIELTWSNGIVNLIRKKPDQVYEWFYFKLYVIQSLSWENHLS